MSNEVDTTGRESAILLAQTIERFQKVIDARKTIPELLKLFDLLDKSNKFDLLHKPACYAVLIKEAAARVSDRHVPALLLALERSPAVAQIHTYFDDEERDLIFGAVIARAFKAADQTSPGLMAIFRRMEENGISQDRMNTICMALAAGMTEAAIDPICEITARDHYGVNFGFPGTRLVK